MRGGFCEEAMVTTDPNPHPYPHPHGTLELNPRERPMELDGMAILDRQKRGVLTGQVSIDRKLLLLELELRLRESLLKS